MDSRENVAFGSTVFGSVASGTPKSPAERMYAQNERLVRATLARDFKRLTPDQREAAACYARLGLWKAAQAFEPSRGIAFSTYAITCIRCEILHYIAWVNRGKNAVCLSLDAPLPGEEDGFTRLDLLQDDPATRPETALLNSTSFDEMLTLLPEAVRVIFLKVYGEGETLQEVADALGISRQRVYQLQQRGLRQLRTRIEQRAALEQRKQHEQRKRLKVRSR